jgi:hypothetical protein
MEPSQKNNDNGVRSFVFTNTGNALIISSVQTTSNCTILSTKRHYFTGKKIDIKYNMIEGQFEKQSQ